MYKYTILMIHIHLFCTEKIKPTHGCQTLELTRRIVRVYEFTKANLVNSHVETFLHRLG